jgi:DNA-binding response OmpR family regulator
MFLAASLIAKRLNEPIYDEPVEGKMCIGDDGAVWIGDHKIGDLVGQELALLRCLYKAGGSVLSRRAVMEQVFGEPYSGNADQESRINTLVARLRKKIEPNPSQARYICTVRSQGYRLSVDG